MIGRMIDRAALMLLGTTGLYLFFLNVRLGIPASCALTFICVMLLRYLVRNRPRRHRVSASQAEAALLSIALKGPDEARADLTMLTRRGEAVFLIKHPQSMVTLDELFEIRRDGGDGNTTVIATCVVQDAAAQFAKGQGLEFIDKNKLVKRIRSTGMFVGEPPKVQTFLPRLRSVWTSIKPRPRMFFYALSLIFMYLTTGQALSLICALGLLGVIGIKLIDRYVD